MHSRGFVNDRLSFKETCKKLLQKPVTILEDNIKIGFTITEMSFQDVRWMGLVLYLLRSPFGINAVKNVVFYCCRVRHTRIAYIPKTHFNLIFEYKRWINSELSPVSLCLQNWVARSGVLYTWRALDLSGNKWTSVRVPLTINRGCLRSCGPQSAVKISFSSFKQSFTSNVNYLKRRYVSLLLITFHFEF